VSVVASDCELFLPMQTDRVVKEWEGADASSAGVSGVSE
jgi:hypothetical protein